jgi:5'(3')-deoxyribonucleotidase
LKLGIDIDGVLADFTRSYGELLVEVSGRKLLPEDFYKGWEPSTWYWERELGYTKEEEAKAWEVINNPKERFWTMLDLIDDSAEHYHMLRAINRDNDLYFITSRPGKSALRQTKEWIGDCYDIDDPNVLICHQKGLACAALELDRYLDDKGENIQNCHLHSPKTEAMLLNMPYNAEFNVLHRVDSVEFAFTHGGC